MTFFISEGKVATVYW